MSSPKRGFKQSVTKCHMSPRQCRSKRPEKTKKRKIYFHHSAWCSKSRGRCEQWGRPRGAQGPAGCAALGACPAGTRHTSRGAPAPRTACASLRTRAAPPRAAPHTPPTRRAPPACRVSRAADRTPAGRHLCGGATQGAGRPPPSAAARCPHRALTTSDRARAVCAARLRRRRP